LNSDSWISSNPVTVAKSALVVGVSGSDPALVWKTAPSGAVALGNTVTMTDRFSVVGNTASFSNISIVGNTASFSRVVTLAGATSSAIISCATAPTEGQHLTNKTYVDSNRFVAGMVVYMAAGQGAPANFSMTLPAGSYKYHVQQDGRVSTNKDAAATTISVSTSWNGTVASITQSFQESTSGGGCGCGTSMLSSASVSAVSNAFTLSSATTATFTWTAYTGWNAYGSWKVMVIRTA
jgi:hypothetical protein